MTCILSHRDGHSEETTLSAGRDDSGNKNSIQAVGSTVTFLQRYTLKAALGLAAAEDDDGKSAVPVETIDAVQVATLRKMLKEAGAPESNFLHWAHVKQFEDIPADQYVICLDAIRQYKPAKKDT